VMILFRFRFFDRGEFLLARGLHQGHAPLIFRREGAPRAAKIDPAYAICFDDLFRGARGRTVEKVSSFGFGGGGRLGWGMPWRSV